MFEVLRLQTRGVVAWPLLFVLLASPASAEQRRPLAGTSQVAAERAPGDAIPAEHFKVVDPAALTNEEALGIYLQVAEEIARGYALAHDPVAVAYQRWRRYNSVPYRSATHGERYVNNYGNALAQGYDRLDQLDHMPVGAILAKDSFAVTGEGDVFPGPLFIMEKMSQGFDPAGRDWRYQMIMPDGSVYGETNGANAEKVEFCAACHRRAGRARDHLFYVPTGYRARPGE